MLINEKVNKMAVLTFGLTIKNYKAKSTDLENLMIDLYEDKSLKQKYSSNAEQEILLQFKAQEEPLRDKRDAARSGEDTEAYKEAMTELQELQEAQDEAIKQIESEAQAYEEDYDLQISSLEDQKAAIDADLESLESARDEAIEDDFGYFQN